MNKLLKLVIIPAVFLQIIAANGVAAAQQTESQENIIVMEEVVVTATKTPEKRNDIANSVIIKDWKDINDATAQTIGEILANEPGVDWRSRGNYGGAKEELHIRGMESNATQVFVNGINLNSPSLGDADVSKIPLNSIEKIEIVKGSGSLLYGSGAMAGTVNIITKSPDREKMDLRAGAGYGSQNTYRLTAEQGMFLSGDFGYYLTAGYKETDGFRDNSYLRHKDASLKLVLDKNDLCQISLYGDYIDRTFGLPGVRPPAGTQDYYRSGIQYYNSEAASLLNKGSDKDGHVVFELKSKPVQWAGFNVKGYYTNTEGYNYTRYDSTGKGKDDWVTNTVLGADGHVDIHPIEGATILLGGEYKDFDWNIKTIDISAEGAPIDESLTGARMFSSGIFSEAQYRPSKYWKILAGVRHEDNSMFGTETLPLYGLILNPTETTALKINHGKHFLAPSLNQLFWPADSMGRGNPDLKPEVGWHTDATIEQSFLNNKIFLSATYFHWNVEDKIQWVIDTTGVSTPINLAGYKADGVELGAQVGPFYDLSLHLNYTYLDAEEESRAYTKQDYSTPDIHYDMVKRRSAYAPEGLFKGDLIFQNSSGLTVTTTGRYTSDRVAYQTEKITTGSVDTKTVTYKLKSYWTADLKIEQRFKNMIFALSGNNLFNEEYDTYLATFTDRSKPTSDPSRTSMAGYPGSGRSIFFSVSYEY